VGRRGFFKIHFERARERASGSLVAGGAFFFFFISREQESELPGALQNKKGHFFSPLFFL